MKMRLKIKDGSHKFNMNRIGWWYFFKLGFTPCKAEQPLRGMELEKEALKD